jgi:hypothetical protein
MQGSLKLIEKMPKTLARLDRAYSSMERGEIDPLQPHMIGACRGTHGRLPRTHQIPDEQLALV